MKPEFQGYHNKDFGNELSERNGFHQVDGYALTVNAAFLQEIKQDNVHFNQLIRSIEKALTVEARIQPRMLSELLSRLRDELETHFALEEFYGYFESARIHHPVISREAEDLKGQHASLYLELNALVEDSERLVYEEEGHRSLDQIIGGFHEFFERFRSHEESEMELAMRLCNEEIGVGD